MDTLPPPPFAGGNAAANVALRKYLSAHAWPTGLQNALIAGTASMPIRFMICDDSGSMMSTDGHRLRGEGNNAK